MITCLLNGCSHVKGWSLSWNQYTEKDKNFIREENTYLALLARKIYPDCKIINMAEQGGSNERIFRTTTEYIFWNSIPELYNYKVDLVDVQKGFIKIFIGWTNPHRLEFYRDKEKKWGKVCVGSNFKYEGIKSIEYRGVIRLMGDTVKQNEYLKLYKRTLFELCEHNAIKLYSYDSMEFWNWARSVYQPDKTGHFGLEIHQEYANILYDNQ